MFERQPGLALPSREVVALAVGDLDGDGVEDVAAACSGANLLLKGDGVGGLLDISAQLPFDLRDSVAVAIAELVSAPGADVAFGGPDGLAVLRNDGAVFVDVTQSLLSPAHAAIAVEELEAGDVDADGFVDLLARDAATIRWLRADGAGGLVSAQFVTTSGTTSGMALADRDADGDLDVAAGSGSFGVSLFVFDAALQSFVAVGAGEVPDDVEFARAVGAWRDLDGDGRPDLVLHDRLQVLWNVAGGPSFVLDARPSLPSFSLGSAGSAAIAAIDPDQDGDLDLVIETSGTIGTFRSLRRNDGSGRFSTEPWAYEVPVALLDVDEDGRLDLIGAHWRAGDGSGGFGSPMAWPNGGSAPRVGDFDGDGEAELLVRTAGGVTLLEPAVGGPQPRDPLLVGDASVAAVADIDGDGRDDVVFVADRLLLFLGGVNGEFVDATATLPADGDRPAAVAVADWDGDGDCDLVVAHVLAAGSNSYGAIYRNDGVEGFVLTGRLVSSQPSPLSLDGIAAADVDEDGRAEVFVQLQLSGFVHAPDEARTEVFEAIDAGGAPREVDAVALGIDGAAPYAGKTSLVGELGPRFADLDGDGDLDVYGARTRINGLRDLTTVPRARGGEPLVVTVVDRGFVDGEVAFVSFGTAPAQAALSGLGTVLVDPAMAVVVVADVAAGEGRAEVAFDVPAGLPPGVATIYAQALLVSGDGDARALTTRSRALVW